MTEEKKDNTKAAAVEPKGEKKKEPQAAGGGKSVYAKKRGEKRRKPMKKERLQDEYEQRLVDVARVTRVMAGGKRMRFRACVVLGNRKGRVGFGIDKGADVTIAVNKAVNQAKKNMIDISIVNETIPHEICYKLGAAKILLKPARTGKGVIAGGAARIVLEIAGVTNVTSKILGTNNKINIVRATINALSLLKKVEPKPADAQKGAKKELKGKAGEPVKEKAVKTAPKTAPKKEAKVGIKKNEK